MARQKLYMVVNFVMVEAYWLIGKRIVEEEQQGKERANYGQELLKTLSVELTNKFGKAFGERNLRDFRQFYLTFQETEIWHTVCAKLSWSHIRLAMRVSDKNTQTYYLKSYFKPLPLQPQIAIALFGVRKCLCKFMCKKWLKKPNLHNRRATLCGYCMH